MQDAPLHADRSAQTHRLIRHVALVLTVLMVLFPPFTSLQGTEYAFILTGPEWSRAMGEFGASLGISARIHWALLIVQIAAVWGIVYGARRYLSTSSAPQ